MQEGAFNFEKSSRDLEKTVEKYSVETINEVEQKSKMLSSTMGNFTNIGLIGNEIENDISDFEKRVRYIDPSQITFTKTKFSIFNPAKTYFKKLKHEEALISTILENLKKKRNILVNDNITLEIEVNRIEEIIEKLEVEYQNGTELKENILKIIEATKTKNEDLSNHYGNNVLKVLEKKMYNIKEMIVVKKQSALALEIIRKNNKEIIENIDRVMNVTTVALKTAIMVANSIYNQKLALNSIKTLEVGTEVIQDTTAKALKDNITKVSQNGSIEEKVELMKNTFAKIFSTIKDVDTKNKDMVLQSEIQILELKKGE